ncbi:hypothetical protein O6H91_22G010100 [Diphasiastrum complanatum]|nr:hypothetical protein O6H91_22G010100 [Diphasiastrum complanatum]
MRGGTEGLKPSTSVVRTVRFNRLMQSRQLTGERFSTLPCLVSRVSEQMLELMNHPAFPESTSVSEFGFKNLCLQDECERAVTSVDETDEKGKQKQKTKRKGVLAVRLKLGNASIKRLLSGAFAGAVSRTAVAPLETIRTHLMVGSAGKSIGAVFSHIIETEGWQGLFRGNGINVLRVAPSKAIELFAYDTVKTFLTSKPKVQSLIHLPASTVAGATAGVCSTLCTYPLELLKTRVTIQHGVYDNVFHAFMKICREEGAKELYRGLAPSLIGVVPYAATNYFAYESLRKIYKNVTNQEFVGNFATLLIGSAAGAIASATTFPLEVARKHMQVGALSGRQVYGNVFHALSSILEHEGPAGLYRGLGASCMKLMPAAGISFMCYEACKRLIIEEENEQKSRKGPAVSV